MTVRERQDGGNPSNSTKIACMLPAVTPSFAYSRSRGRAPEQREMRIIREQAGAVFGVIAGVSAIAHVHADAEAALS